MFPAKLSSLLCVTGYTEKKNQIVAKIKMFSKTVSFNYVFQQMKLARLPLAFMFCLVNIKGSCFNGLGSCHFSTSISLHLGFSIIVNKLFGVAVSKGVGDMRCNRLVKGRVMPGYFFQKELIDHGFVGWLEVR